MKKTSKETKKQGRKLVIINPYKFGYKSDRIDSFIDMVHDELGTDTYVTLSKRNLGRVVRNSKEYETLIAVGGDGTISEVINNMDVENQKLAIIPMGTGNGFALELNVTDTKQAIENIQAGKTEKIDLLRIRYTEKGKEKEKYCVSTSGFGYIANVVKLAERKFKHLKKFCYPVSAVITAFFNKNRIAMANGAVYSNIVVNNTVFAGKFGVFEEAKMNDGLMDVLIAEANPFTQMLHNLSLLTKKFYFRTGIEFKSTEEEFAFKKDTTLMIDGEIVNNANNIKYEVLKNILTIIK